MTTTINGAAFACTALALSLVLTGCDAASTTGAAIAPAGVVAVNAVLVVAPAPTASFAVCSGGGFLTSGLTLIVSSARPVSVGDVTLHMNDGSNLGGPGITVPQLQLAGGAPTTVPGGGSRSFLLTPALGCGFAAPRTVHADIGVIDAGGTRMVIHATAAVP